MLPLIELKNYSRFIVQYLIKLISNTEEATLTKEQYVSLLDVVFSNKKNFPNDLKQDLLSIVPKLTSFLSTSKKESIGSYIDFYLKKISIAGSDALKDCLCDVITDGFSRDHSGLEYWSKIYNKNITSSAILLKYIGNYCANLKLFVHLLCDVSAKNWQKLSSELNRKVLSQTLNDIFVESKELRTKKKKDEGLNEAIRISEVFITYFIIYIFY